MVFKDEISRLMPDTVVDAAATALLVLMRGFSEEGLCAGWYNGVEHDLWRARPGSRIGRYMITEQEIAMLRALSDYCGGWWYWPENGDREQFVRLEEWRSIAESHSRR